MISLKVARGTDIVGRSLANQIVNLLHCLQKKTSENMWCFEIIRGFGKYSSLNYENAKPRGNLRFYHAHDIARF